MEEKSTLIKHPDNEIAYVIAKVYGVTVKFMYYKIIETYQSINKSSHSATLYV